MTLESRINEDMKTAMKAQDKNGLRGIRAIKAAILLAKTDGSGKDLDEASEIKLVQKLIKQRQDSLDIYTKQGRDDLAQVEEQEIEVIQKYLPKQIEGAELEAIIQNIVTELGASSMADMGKVMAAASAKLSGQADGKSISTIVKQLLSK